MTKTTMIFKMIMPGSENSTAPGIAFCPTKRLSNFYYPG